jgi:hypothetical protein
MKLTKKLLARFCNTALVLLLLASASPSPAFLIVTACKLTLESRISKRQVYRKRCARIH